MPEIKKYSSSHLVAIIWFTLPAISRKSRANLFCGTMPRPTSLETMIVWALILVRIESNFLNLALISLSFMPFKIRLESKSVRQSIMTMSNLEPIFLKVISDPRVLQRSSSEMGANFCEC